MLVQLALIVFAMFAVLTLVIDLGVVTLTRVQMQNVADAAAVEGVRYRNVRSDGYASDCVRRIAARDLVRLTFDDDGDLDAGDARQFGAGPVLDMTEGTTDWDGLRTMSLPALHVYKPELLYNLSNATEGDLVAGRYDPSIDYLAARGPDEGAAYERGDFTPAPPWNVAGLPPCPADMPEPGSEPVSGTGPLLTPAHDAFLVRLRRTNDVDALDEIENTSSRGPTLPLLFGRGALIGSDPDSGYSVRRDGLTVRATAIAQVRPAMRVGLRRPEVNLPGATTFSVTLGFAAALEGLAVPAIGAIAANGQIAASVPLVDGGGAVVIPQGAVIGWYSADPTLIATVGNSLLPSPPAICDPAATPDELAYAPVAQALGSPPVARIIGFVAIRVTWPACAGFPPLAVTLGRGPHGVASANATALLPDGVAAMSDADLAAVLAASRALAANGIGVLAPAVAR